MTAPDIIGTVRGYRYWLLPEEWNGELKAVAFEYIWQNGLNVAHHNAIHSRRVWPEHGDAGDNLCGCCGFYSLYYPPPTRNVPIGVIESEGDIWLHEWGLRAKRARIAAIQFRNGPARKQLARNYPDARIYRSRRKMLRDYPPVSENCGVPAKNSDAYASVRALHPFVTIGLILVAGILAYMVLSIVT